MPPVVDGVTVAGNVCVIGGSVLAGTLVEAVVEDDATVTEFELFVQTAGFLHS